MKINETIVNLGYKISQKLKKPEEWYSVIIKTFEMKKDNINKQEDCLQNYYHVLKISEEDEILIYMSLFKDKFLEIRLFSKNSESFDLKYDCYVDKYMLVIDDIIIPNIDSVANLPNDVFIKILEYIEQKSKELKLTSIRINFSIFRKPFNEIVKKICLAKDYKIFKEKNMEYLFKLFK